MVGAMKIGNSGRYKRQRLTDLWWNPGKEHNPLKVAVYGVFHAAAFALMFATKRSTK